MAEMTSDQDALVAGVAPALFADALRQFGRVNLRASGYSMLPRTSRVDSGATSTKSHSPSNCSA